jgi:uncharacterized membrane protein YgdD (TMEM256/DUF423 family)
MQIKIFLIFAAVSGLLAVALGAFGAHALRGKLSENLLHAFETGVSYQMTHTLALLGVCLLMVHWGERTSLLVAASGFSLGILLFSGSLYGLALTGMKWLGPVTPLGGLAFLVGWAALLVSAWNYKAA